MILHQSYKMLEEQQTSSAKSWKRYFRQKKKPTGLRLTNLYKFESFSKRSIIKEASGHSRNTNDKVSLHKFDCNIHSSSLDQSSYLIQQTTDSTSEVSIESTNKNRNYSLTVYSLQGLHPWYYPLSTNGRR